MLYLIVRVVMLCCALLLKFIVSCPLDTEYFTDPTLKERVSEEMELQKR